VGDAQTHPLRAHVFLFAKPTSARLMGINSVSVRTGAFVLVGMLSVFAGLSLDLWLLFLAEHGRRLSCSTPLLRVPRRHLGVRRHRLGSSVRSSPPTSSAPSMGLRVGRHKRLYTQLLRLVIVISVVLQTIIERRIRRQSLTGR